MKASKLIEILKRNPDLDVYLQGDDEGNSYSELHGGEESIVIKDGRDLLVYSKNWTADQAGMEEEEWEKIKNDKKNISFVLY